MLSPSEFIKYLKLLDDAQERRCLARVLLNGLYDSSAFPVDLSEVRDLSPISSALAFSFLNCVAASPRSWCWEHDEFLDEFVELALNRKKSHA